MKKIDFKKALDIVGSEIDQATSHILYDLIPLNGLKTSELIPADGSEPMVIEYYSDIYLRSTACVFDFYNAEQRDVLLKAMEDMDKKARGYSLDFDAEIINYDSNDEDKIVGYIWCAVLWPIKNWYKV